MALVAGDLANSRALAVSRAMASCDDEVVMRGSVLVIFGYFWLFLATGASFVWLLGSVRRVSPPRA